MPLRKKKLKTGDSFRCHNCWQGEQGKSPIGIKWAEARDAVKDVTVHETAQQTSYSAHGVTNAKTGQRTTGTWVPSWCLGPYAQKGYNGYALAFWQRRDGIIMLARSKDKLYPACSMGHWEHACPSRKPRLVNEWIWAVSTSLSWVLAICRWKEWGTTPTLKAFTHVTQHV